ncbi:MAG TPA: hypothetical protein VFP98_10380 [Candidatus Polarisedimenticolia bacterium]|nr:hypothetical protein [Candidatus Polarisedimenticolia bacterium]
MSTRRRRRAGTILFGLLSAAAAGLAVTWFMFSRWSDIRTAAQPEADRLFEEARAASGGGPAYIRIDADGTVHVARELELEEPVDLRTLHLLAWEPARSNLVRIDFPFWFVRVKMTKSVNLGTLTSALAGDWERLDLSVSEEDLQRRGPGLILDHRRPDGSRVLIRTD